MVAQRGSVELTIILKSVAVLKIVIVLAKEDIATPLITFAPTDLLLLTIVMTVRNAMHRADIIVIQLVIDVTAVPQTVIVLPALTAPQGIVLW
jgi:hypothetical protein